MKNSEQFLDAVVRADNLTTWEQSNIKQMRIVQCGILHLADRYGMNGKDLPYDNYAIGSICNRADVSGGAIHRVSDESFKAHMNEYFNVAKDEKFSIVNVYNGTIFAAHSQNYKILNIKDCVSELFRYIDCNYPDAEVKGFYVDPIATMVDIALNSPEISDKYANALNLKISDTIYPVLRFVTSNTGWSGANLIPLIYINKRTLITSEPIILKHEGKATVDKFAKNCEMSFSLMLEGAEKLNELSQISIEYPVNCAANIAQEIKLPKKATVELLHDMEDDYGQAMATAKDVYLYLSKLVLLYDDEVKKFKMADQLSRALSLDFTKFDRASATWLKESTEDNYYQNFNRMSA